MPLKNNRGGEGLANNTAITTSNAVSPDPNFNTVSVGSGTIRSVTTFAARGSSSIELIAPAAGAACLFGYTFPDATDVAVRFYVRFSSLPTAAEGTIMQFRSASANLNGVNVLPTGGVRLTDATGAIRFTSAAGALAVDTWYRFEVSQRISATAGQISLNVFLLDNTTPITGLIHNSVTTLNTGTASIAMVRFGKITTAQGMAGTYFDELAFNDGTLAAIGPATTPNATPTIAADPDVGSAVPGTVYTTSVTASDSDGTIVSYSASAPGLTLTGSGNTRNFIAPTPASDTLYTVTWTATDDGGLTATTTQTFYVVVSPASATRVGFSTSPILTSSVSSVEAMFPAGTSVGDLVIAVGTAERATASPVLPEGFTVSRTTVLSTAMVGVLGWKRLVAADLPFDSIQMTVPSIRRMMLALVVYRGSQDPVFVSGTGVWNGAATTTLTGPAYVPGVANSIALGAMSIVPMSAPFQGRLYSPSAGWTELIDATTDGTTANAVVYIAERVIPGGAGVTQSALALTDLGGASSAYVPSVMVIAPGVAGNLAPNLTAAPAILNVEPGSMVTSSVVASDDDGTIASYSATASGLTLGGGGASRTFRAPLSLTDQTYTVNWTVTDNTGASRTASQDISVLACTVRVAQGGVGIPAIFSLAVASTAERFPNFVAGSIKPLGQLDQNLGRGQRNVGPRLETYVPVTGTYTIVPGTTVTGREFFGKVVGRGNASTLFQDCIFHGASVASAVQDSAILGTSFNLGGTVFDHCRIDITDNQGFTNGIEGGNYTWRYGEIYGGVDGVVFNTFGDATVECSRIANGWYTSWWNKSLNAVRTATYTDFGGRVWTAPFPSQASGDVHGDGLQVMQFDGWVFRGNNVGDVRAVPYTSGWDPTVQADYANILATRNAKDFPNAAAMISGSSGTDKIGILYENNWLAGGAARVNVNWKSFDDAAGVLVRNNRFTRTSYGFYIYAADDAMAEFTGNVYDDNGAAVPIERYGTVPATVTSTV